MVEAFGQLELSVPSLNVLLGEVEETTLLQDHTLLGGLVGKGGKVCVCVCVCVCMCVCV